MKHIASLVAHVVAAVTVLVLGALHTLAVVRGFLAAEEFSFDFRAWSLLMVGALLVVPMLIALVETRDLRRRCDPDVVRRASRKIMAMHGIVVVVSASLLTFFGNPLVFVTLGAGVLGLAAAVVRRRYD